MKICFITAIYGNYESSCKKFAPQSVPADFICFTDNAGITDNGWIIDTTPYHLTNPSPLDDGTFRNSMTNNRHTFNVAKYYKQAFHNIPRLASYDVVVWLDGTIEIIDEKTSEYILKKMSSNKIIGWHHEHRGGVLAKEVEASHFYRYTSTFWNGQRQPYQDVDEQYRAYVDDGFTDVGVWITCFVAFLKTDPEIRAFLDLWYMQNLQYTTQDQIGFPYVCYKMQRIPYTLPNSEISGDCPHQRTQFYVKHDHGR
jgi:hypothetical protein